MSIANIRDEFPMLRHWRHFNCAGIAPLSNDVGAELLRIPQEVIEQGPVRFFARDESFLRVESSRSVIAEFLGVDPDEIAFTTQFSTAVNIVIEGLAWSPGDEIIVTDQEHPSLLIPVMNMARRRGLTVHRIPVSDDDAAVLSALDSVLSDRTRLVAFSHVTTETGTRLPAKEITTLAHERDSLVFIDAAHSLGQIPVDLRDIGCDFCGIVGYKWLFGPYPSAALYVDRNLLDRLEITWTGSLVTQASSVSMGIDDLVWIAGARRFEYGGRPYSYDSAMSVGVAFVERLGLDTIGGHARELTAHLISGLTRIDGARVHSTRDPNRATGIATISLAGIDGVMVSTMLRERYRMITRPALRGSSVRISLAAFINDLDIEALVDGLSSIAEAHVGKY